MRSRWFGLVIAALAVAMSVWAYPQLPPTMTTHWSLNGTPDGFSSRLWALVIVPIVLVAMTVLFNVLPRVDPRRENYAKFLSSYWLIANAVIVFLLVAHAMVIAAGLGFSVIISRASSRTGSLASVRPGRSRAIPSGAGRTAPAGR